MDPPFENRADLEFEDSRESPRPRRWWRVPLWIVFDLFAVFLLFEVGLRVGYEHSTVLRRKLYMSGMRPRYDLASDLPELLRMTPNGLTPHQRNSDFVLNSKGLRTHEYERAKAPGTFRVVVLGDSFAYSSAGVPFRSLWHTRMGELLAERLGIPVEIISLGVNAVGVDFYLRMWELEGSRLGADLVVVSFFMGNDLKDSIPFAGEAEGLEGLARISYAVRLARNWNRDRTGLSRTPAAPEDPDQENPRSVFETGGVVLPRFSDIYDPERPTLSEKAFENIHRRRFRMFVERFGSELEEGLESIQSHVLALRDQVESSGARLAFMLIPGETQVNPELEERIARKMGLTPEDYDVGEPSRRVHEWLEEQGIPCLDLAPVFAAAPAGVKFYKALDTHWNVEGNLLGARALTDFLVERVIED